MPPHQLQKALGQFMVQTFLAFLNQISANYPLHFFLPVAAMIIMACYYLLNRNSVKAWLGEKRLLFLRGFLLAPLFAVAVLAVENYRYTDYYRFDSYLNAYEFYHYYIGTKYAREVGYGDMYMASLVADSETGMKWKHSSGTITDLNTGKKVSAKTVLAQADKYKSRFTPERWEEFKKDIVWFKDRMIQSRWSGVLRDKGYNGTPVWTMLVGGLLSNRVSTDSDRNMMILAVLDPLLILITFLMVLWAFGPRTAFLMITLLGTCYMMKYWHLKGAYLRTDWVMCLVMSVCLIRKKHFALAGALTGYATLSRIFPAVLLFGIGARFFWLILDYCLMLLRRKYLSLGLQKRSLGERLVVKATIFLFIFLLLWGSYAFVSAVALPWIGSPDRSISGFFNQMVSGAGGHSAFLQLFTFISWVALALAGAVTTLRGLWLKEIDRRYFYFFLSFAVITATLFGVSLIYWHGTDYWAQYTEKIGRHNTDISTWRMGFKYIFMADFGQDFNFLEKAFKDWTPVVRPAWYMEKHLIWWKIQLLVLAVTLAACRNIKDYRAYILGFVPLFFLVSPTYYYYIMLLVPLLFFAPRIDHGRYAVGLALMYITGMVGFGFYGLWRQDYATYYWLSVLVMITVLYMLFLALLENTTAVMAQKRLRALAEATPTEGATPIKSEGAPCCPDVAPAKEASGDVSAGALSEEILKVVPGAVSDRQSDTPPVE
ncbi:MAG TPA: hypothetical protein PKN92_09100 [Candidatus Hydrogenedentes bacterium]|nr:hypothetical protein [Candidatus Hydrogenedentota bacterium]